MSGPIIFAIILIYLIICSSILYFCVIADPNTNDIAYYVTVTIPEKLWIKIGKVIGPKKLNLLSKLMELALVFFYFAVVLGVWVIVFLYIYPWIYQSTNHVSIYHTYIGYIVFVLCFTSWYLASHTSPGLITERTWIQYNHYKYDNLMFLSNKKCDSTNLIKIPRSKYDRLKYNSNIPRYDHFCGWVNNTIGEENYRYFLLFLTIHVGMCFYGSFVTILLFRGEIIEKKLFQLTFFDRSTGESFQADWSIVLQYLFTRRMGECAALVIMFVMGIALGLFLGYHIHLTNNNMTTNEATKWQDIKAWYKKQQKKYQEEVKQQGLVNNTTTSTTTTSPPEPGAIEVTDNDVTCTPTPGGNKNNNVVESSSSQPAAGPSTTTTITDPGPVPPNLYNRGFIENWKEVIFPISLRKENLERVAVARARAKAKAQAARTTTTTTTTSPAGKATSTTEATTSSSSSSPSSRPKPKPTRRARGSKPKVT